MARFNEQFGRFVREQRGEETQIRFAARLGISHSYLSHIEAGLVPKRSRVEEMVQNLGADLAPWFAAAGYAPDSSVLGPAVSEPRRGSAYVGNRDKLAVIGTVGEHGLVTYVERASTVRYLLLVESPTVGGAFNAGDEIVIDPHKSPHRNARVIVKEAADASHRLVRYVSRSKRGSEQVKVEPLDAAPGLVKPVELEGKVVGVVVRWTDKEF